MVHLNIFQPRLCFIFYDESVVEVDVCKRQSAAPAVAKHQTVCTHSQQPDPVHMPFRWSRQMHHISKPRNCVVKGWQEG